jgi:hypothetical protein
MGVIASLVREPVAFARSNLFERRGISIEIASSRPRTNHPKLITMTWFFYFLDTHSFGERCVQALRMASEESLL